ncbi:ATP-binding protein [Dinoroseobacter sp. PD6]|uniref:ATP-binding protein n=1 Tax=Dinoroseobacter sp. PD6 TaxID=3028384 RepID=UPI00237B39CE|nr:ATP-binding protein [Dinoroseobacter sp. PD6]MDD9717210.1 ATP-binding protein [Dinoroseobacter sp. PD6]
MKEFEKTYEFPSRYAQVRETLAELLAALRDAGVESEDAGIVEVVLAEAMNNVVEHAYRESPDEVVRLRCALEETGLRVVLDDSGVAMPGLNLPEGRCPTSDTPLQDLPEGGFGWHLIHTLTEELIYTRAAERNETRFIIPFAAGG